MPVSPWFMPVFAFLAGSIPFGLLVARAHGIDIRRHGSGNIGATNVYRVIGKGYGVLVFTLDFLKGLLPVLVAVRLAPGAAVGESLPVIATALAAIIGHNHPPWLGFKGGKGIATSAGALLALFPLALIIGLLVWMMLVRITGYVSVGSMGAALAIPLAVAGEGFLSSQGHRPAHLAFALAVAALAIWRHRSNIRNLRAGTEHRIHREP
jgi:acyl phosphate:glycerol-3-phosphate acyltransferase